ncbi:phage virion morphogenesis protein [Azospirillum argentinense]
MDAGLQQLDAWMARALAALAPAERQALFRRIGRELLKRNRSQMARQVGPDGTAWAPRARDRHGQVRKAAKMMTGLRAARRLKATANPGGADVGWGGAAARIALVHQLGGVDFVDRANSDRKIRYPVRPLIGLTDADAATIKQTVLTHLAERLS